MKSSRYYHKDTMTLLMADPDKEDMALEEADMALEADTALADKALEEVEGMEPGAGNGMGLLVGYCFPGLMGVGMDRTYIVPSF